MFRDDQVVTKADTTTDGYTFLGVELLHLLKFICVNAMGFRKILKKHDKICQRAAQYFGREHEHGRHDEHTGTHRLVDGPEDNLQHLANSDSVAVIHSSLLVALSELEAAQMGGMQVYQQIEEGDPRKNFLRNGFPVELVRFKCCVSSIQTLREYAQKVNAPFKNFLSRKAMIIIGQDLGDLERATQQALQILLHFQPDSLLTMDEAALQDWQRRVLLRTGMELDLLESGSFTDLEDGAQSWGGVNSASMIINLLSTLLYTVRNRELWSYGRGCGGCGAMNYFSILALFYMFAGQLLYCRPNGKPLRYPPRDGRCFWRNPRWCLVPCSHICRLSLFVLVHQEFLSIGSILLRFFALYRKLVVRAGIFL